MTSTNSGEGAYHSKNKTTAIRSKLTKAAFINYLADHPEERFWQAVRNFSGIAFIIASDMPPTDRGQNDTFYWEENQPNTKP